MTATTGTITWLADRDVLVQDGGLLVAGDDLGIDAGRDMHLFPLGELTVVDHIGIRGDQVGPIDPLGSTIWIEGTIDPVLTQIYGGDDEDFIWFTPIVVIGHTEIYGGLSDDRILIDQIPTVDYASKFHPSTTGPASIVNGLETVRARDMVDVDGQAGADEYEVNLIGTSDYIVRAHDTGLDGDGADILTINGLSTADVFLIRANYNAPESPAFVARLNRTGPGGGDFADAYERVNYDRTINVLRVNGCAGNDEFYSDDTSAIMTLDGGAGDDLFQFGQLFGSPRTSTSATWVADGNGDGFLESFSTPGTVAPGDEVSTLQTTRGFLTRGISFPAVVYGGDGDDRMYVYSNKALLKLFGEDGNDEFLVRAFILVTGGVAGDATALNGGAGQDHIEYNINAPVSIDGGDGVDTIVVVGTEADDNFVVTMTGVMGAGLNVTYEAVEKVEIDGMEGNDHFYVLSTNPKVITTIIGNLGTDTFDVGGDVTGTIVALSVEGASGFINHTVFSLDPAFNGAYAPGIRLNVATPAIGGVVVTQSGGKSSVVEDGGTAAQDDYTLKMADSSPSTPTVAYITVSAALAPSKDLAAGGGSILVSADGGATWWEALVLTFDTSQTTGPTAWARTQTILFRAISDTAQEGDKTIVISHSIESTNPAYDRLNIANVEVKVYDDDKPLARTEITGRRHDRHRERRHRHLHGGAREGAEPRRDRDRHAPDRLDAGRGHQRQPACSCRSGTPRLHTITFDGTNWNVPFTVRVSAAPDTTPENRMFRTIFHFVTSTGGLYSVNQAVREVDIDIRDDDIGGVIVIQSDGTTLVPPGPVGDTYTLRLTRAPTSPGHRQHHHRRPDARLVHRLALHLGRRHDPAGRRLRRQQLEHRRDHPGHAEPVRAAAEHVAARRRSSRPSRTSSPSSSVRSSSRAARSGRGR